MVPRLPSPPSKAGWGFSEILILAGLIFLLTRFAPLLAALAPVAAYPPATAQGQSVIPSRVIKVVEFDDNGRTYRVDIESGSVSFTETNDVKPVPPAPPKPNPPVPVVPELTGLALRVNESFRARVTNDTVKTANELIGAIDMTMAYAGGLNLKGQQILDELRKQVEWKGLVNRLNGFPLGDLMAAAIGDDETKIIPALRDIRRGLEAVR